VGKGVPSGCPAVKDYDIRLHTLATNECQELASKFKERARKSLVGIMDVYIKFVQDVQRYLQWPDINFRDEYTISFDFFQELKNTYEVIEVEVQEKEVMSKECIQESLVKSSQEFSLYTTFIHKFMVSMEKYKECNLTLNVKKEHIFNSREQIILT
jgi:hypothetical protein